MLIRSQSVWFSRCSVTSVISCRFHASSFVRNDRNQIGPEKLKRQLPSTRYAYPERLLIYNSGTFKTTILSIIKVTAIFSFLGSLYANAYPQLTIPDGSLLEAARISLISAIPPTAIHMLTHPYVATVSLHLPRTARASPAALEYFTKRIPTSTKLSISGIRPWGTPRTRELLIGELRKIQPRIGHIENYATERGQKATFGFGERFYIGDVSTGEKRARVEGVWQQVDRAIAAEQKRDPKGHP